MDPPTPALPEKPLRPRAFGGKGAEGLKKEITSSNIPTHFVVLLTLFFLLISNSRSQEQAPDVAAQPPPSVPIPQSEKDHQRAAIKIGEFPPASMIWTLMGLVGFLSLATVGLALYCVRLTRLRLNSNSGATISFGDSVAEWMQALEAHWNQSHQRQSENAAATITQLREVNEAFDKQGKNHFQQLVHAFHEHHKIVGGELKAMGNDLAETREILAAVKTVAEEKKAELEEYKTGYHISASKKALVHLCDVRENLKMLRTMLEKTPTADSPAIKTLKDIDWELCDTLETFDLFEIDAKPGMPIRDPALSGKYKILGSHPAPKPEYQGRIAEVTRLGYFIRIPRGDTEETLLFRPVQVTVFGNPNATQDDQAPQPFDANSTTQQQVNT